ncbi:Crossover junction endodeoxyribonuclease ruvC [Salinisphaera dokdonensis CL-ES53]|uniref:Crossover junction endodeoxyribonuclease RuvC n=1 Tax=Salinisphaera dokdonensis CL-ES53 TaxID=1304272 RepID=A0ABV2B316_9GAMM
MAVILGIDPGSTITGYAVVEAGAQPRAIEIDCIRLPRTDFPTRLGLIFQRLSEVIETHRPEQMAIENVFVSRNAASALKLGQARGAAICSAASRGIPVSEYTPTQIKQAIVGRGHADKTQIQHMVKVLLGVQGALQADAADAAGVAICHIHHERTASRMRVAATTTGRRA